MGNNIGNGSRCGTCGGSGQNSTRDADGKWVTVCCDTCGGSGTDDSDSGDDRCP